MYANTTVALINAAARATNGVNENDEMTCTSCLMVFMQARHCEPHAIASDNDFNRLGVIEVAGAGGSAALRQWRLDGGSAWWPSWR